MNTCGVISAQDIAGCAPELCECPRPAGHNGPHLITCADGGYIAYDFDWECECESCLREDRDNWCEIYTHEVSPSEAQLLVTDPEYPWKWDIKHTFYAR